MPRPGERLSPTDTTDANGIGITNRYRFYPTCRHTALLQRLQYLSLMKRRVQQIPKACAVAVSANVYATLQAFLARSGSCREAFVLTQALMRLSDVNRLSLRKLTRDALRYVGVWPAEASRSAHIRSGR